MQLRTRTFEMPMFPFSLPIYHLVNNIDLIYLVLVYLRAQLLPYVVLLDALHRLCAWASGEWRSYVEEEMLNPGANTGSNYMHYSGARIPCPSHHYLSLTVQFVQGIMSDLE